MGRWSEETLVFRLYCANVLSFRYAAPGPKPTFPPSRRGKTRYPRVISRKSRASKLIKKIAACPVSRSVHSSCARAPLTLAIYLIALSLSLSRTFRNFPGLQSDTPLIKLRNPARVRSDNGLYFIRMYIGVYKQPRRLIARAARFNYLAARIVAAGRNYCDEPREMRSFHSQRRRRPPRLHFTPAARVCVYALLREHS